MILIILAIVPLKYFLLIAHGQVVDNPVEPEFRIGPKDVPVRHHGLCVVLRVHRPLHILLLVRNVH